jgi:hypothetical protein
MLPCVARDNCARTLGSQGATLKDADYGMQSGLGALGPAKVWPHHNSGHSESQSLTMAQERATAVPGQPLRAWLPGLWWLMLLQHTCFQSLGGLFAANALAGCIPVACFHYLPPMFFHIPHIMPQLPNYRAPGCQMLTV